MDFMETLRKGAKIAVHLQGEDVPTLAEVIELKQRGEELHAIIKAARSDGRIEHHEIVLIAGKVIEVVSLGVWWKMGAWLRRVFGRK